jgi:hypothetical protein
LAFALSGSPAALAACMALCVQSPATTPAPAPEAAAHAHHGSTAPGPSADPVTTSPESDSSPDARLAAGCRTCCPDDQGVFSAAGLDRTQARTPRAAPTVLVAPFHPVAPALAGSASRTPLRAPSHFGVLPALRI